jgi:protein PhnA
VVEVPPASEPAADRCVMICERCGAQLDGSAPLDATHWFCLQQSAWSEVPAVQVTSWRMLHRVVSSWAHDLLEQLYLDDETLAWAKAGQETAGDAGTKTVDSNGTALADGDSVTLIKDLDVKGAGFVAKRGTLVKNIRLTDDPANVEGRVNKVALVLKACFLKKVV